ncbi:MAG: VanZ family protein [Elusimicrobia bacterium]|nr:VanZ family protein [Elusimicrobiota bacterium]
MNLFSIEKSSSATLFQLWGRVIFWCFLITIFSSQPNYTGEGLSFETWLGASKFILRKIAHLLEYGLLGIFSKRALEKTFLNHPRYHFILTFFFTLIFSMSDEWHQSFVYGRGGTIFDVMIDSCGSFIGLFFLEKHDSNQKFALRDEYQNEKKEKNFNNQITAEVEN